MHLSAALLLLTALPQASTSPLEDAVLLVARDAAKIDPVNARSIRYLSLCTLPTARRKDWCYTLCVQLNLLSRSSDLVRPDVVLEDGSVRRWSDADKEEWPTDEEWPKAAALRFNIRDYEWKTETWDKLAEQDYVFHAQTVTEEVQEYGRFEQGRWVKTRDVKTGKKVITPAYAPWLSVSPECGKAILALAARTSSVAAILQAESFLWQTAAQFGRRVGYYGLLEVKNRDDFQRLVGFDAKATKAFSVEMLAAVGTSGVARQPRRIAAFDKIGGDYLSTFDVDIARGRKDPLTFLDDQFDHDAEEVFAHGSNRLWKVALFDKNGNRQDSAPDFVGFNRFTHNNDGKIHAGYTCFGCHDNGGVQDVNNWSRRVLASPLTLKGVDPEQLRDLRRRYLRNLKARLDQARRPHEAALQELVGIAHKDFAKLLLACYAEVDVPVDMERAARETGFAKADFQKRLVAYEKKNLVPISLAIYLRDEEEQEGVPYEVFVDKYTDLQLMLRGLQQLQR